jgi:hypothetical protein
MTRRLIVLVALAAMLAVPAVSFADGGSTTTPTSAHDGSKLSAALDRASARLDKRFAAFSAKCLVQNAPTGCARAARRGIRRITLAKAVLTRLENAIETKCGGSNPPGLCANAGTITGKIDALLSKLQSDASALVAAFPKAAGSGAASQSSSSS